MNKKQRERAIEKIYGMYCSGIQINIMDIGKVFKEGERLLDNGITPEQVGQQLRAFTLKLSENV